MRVLKKDFISWELLNKYRVELMGCSILGIILFHWYENCIKHEIYVTGFLKVFSLGSRFVDVFLILSGIGLYYSFRNNNSIKNFYFRRMTKILPAYCILTIPYWIYYDLFFSKKQIYDVLIDFSFLSFIVAGNRRFWFIGLIIGLYVLFPIFYCIIYSSEKRWKGFAILLALYLLFAGAFWWIFPDVYANIEIALGRIPSFLTGIFWGKRVYEKEKIRFKYFVCYVLGIVLFTEVPRICTDAFINNIVYRVSGVFWALSILIGVSFIMNCIESINIYQNYLRKGLRFLGGITMEVYILHVAFRSIFDYPPEVIKYALLITVSIIIAVPVHKIGIWIGKRIGCIWCMIIK